MVNLVARYAYARIAYGQARHAAVGSKTYPHSAALAVVFYGVADKIIAYTLHLIQVGLYVYVVAAVNAQLHVPAVGQRRKVGHPLPYAVRQVEAAHGELHLAVLNLAKVENLANKPEHDVDILSYQAEHGALLRGQVVGLEHAPDGVGNESERCAELMAYVGEEHQLGVGCILAHAPLYDDGAVEGYKREHQQHKDNDEHHEVDLLMAVLREIHVHAVVHHVELVV